MIYVIYPFHSTKKIQSNMEKVFLITLQYIKPHFAIDQYFPKHKIHLEKYEESGHIICSGRRNLKTGEFILCQAKNRQEAQQIVAEDPFDQFQLAVFEIEEYHLITTSKAFLG